MTPLVEYDAMQTTILDAAVACVAKYGFSGLTTRQIAQEAGVNEVTLFRRFKNKNGIINAAFQREAALVKGRVGDYTGNLEDDLLRIVSTYIDIARSRSYLTPIILLELPGNPDLREAAEHPLQVLIGLTGILEQYQQDGRLKPEPPLAAFAALIGPMMFALFTGNIYPEIFNQFDAHDFVAKFLHGRGLP